MGGRKPRTRGRSRKQPEITKEDLFRYIQKASERSANLQRILEDFDATPIARKQIKDILQKTVHEMGKSWKMKLPDALWAYRTAYKTPLGMSPYQLVYGKTYHLPVKLEHWTHWAIRKFNMNFQKAGMRRKQ